MAADEDRPRETPTAPDSAGGFELLFVAPGKKLLAESGAVDVFNSRTVSILGSFGGSRLDRPCVSRQCFGKSEADTIQRYRVHLNLPPIVNAHIATTIGCKCVAKRRFPIVGRPGADW